MNPSSSLIAPLIEAVSWLAAPAERQIAEVMRAGTGAGGDELARAFDDAVHEVVGRRLAVLPFEALDRLQDVDELLVQMADDPEAWTPTALCESAAWQAVRRAAVLALTALYDHGAEAHTRVADGPRARA